MVKHKGNVADRMGTRSATFEIQSVFFRKESTLWGLHRKAKLLTFTVFKLLENPI